MSLGALFVEIRNLHFLFVNIYASNIGEDGVQFFNKLEHFLKQQQDGDVIVLGGDLHFRLYTR